MLNNQNTFEVTADLLKPFILNNKRHPNYADANELYDKLRVHVNGEVPTKLLEITRPNQPMAVLNYVKNTYQPKTKEIVHKIINSLTKIKRADDFSMKYNAKEFPKRIAEDETLQKYCEEQFMSYGSVTEYTFSEILRNYAMDANAFAVVLVDENSVSKNQSDYNKPFVKIFNSDGVIWINPDLQWVLFKDNLKSDITKADKSIEFNAGDIYWIITTNEIIRIEQTDADGSIAETFNHQHNIGSLPLVQLRGNVINSKGGQPLYESRFNCMRPALDDMIIDYLDYRGSKIMHLFPERWEFANMACRGCSGTGQIVTSAVGFGGAPMQTGCPDCDGTGYRMSMGGHAGKSAYSKIVVRPSQGGMGEAQTPIPPAGYIEKSVEIIKLQKEDVESDGYDALAAMNFQFLDQTPLNQSGKAKEVDKDELNNTVYGVASDLIAIMKKIYFYIGEYRYLIALPNPAERALLQPTIVVPNNFDLMTANYLITDVATAKDKTLSPAIQKELEINYAKRKFCDEPDALNKVILAIELDPYPNKASADKMADSQNSWIDEIDGIISANINLFVERALAEDEAFVNKTFDEKRQVMQKYATEIQTKNSAKAKLAMKVAPAAAPAQK